MAAFKEHWRKLTRPARRRVARLIYRHPDPVDPERPGPWILRSTRQFYLSRECAIIGRAEQQLTSIQRESIRGILDGRMHLWRSGMLPLPKHANILSGPTVRALIGSIVVVMPQYIECDPTYIDSDIAFHIAHSAADAGIRVESFAADAITFGGRDDDGVTLRKLEDLISNKRPEVLVIDGDFFPRDRQLDVNFLLDVKRRFDVKILSFTTECYDHQPNFLAYWDQVADLSVVQHRQASHYRNASASDRIMVFPWLPYHEQVFAAERSVQRDIDLSYVGSDSRQRRFFMDTAECHGIRTFSRFHRRKRDEAPTLTEFARILGRSKLSFANGWIDTGDCVITGRVAESILGGTLLIEEAGGPTEDYLVPFIHYVRVANIHQFVSFCQFLLEDDERRRSMAEESVRFWREHYGSRLFWLSVSAKLLRHHEDR